jgi:hypothetical protein
MTARQAYGYALVGVVLVSFALGAAGLDADALHHDEVWSLINSGGEPFTGRTLAGVWSQIADNDPYQAPGYPLLFNAWGQLVGWSAFAGRTLSLLMGVLAVAVTARLATDALNPRAGLLAGALLGFSPYFVHFTHEMRAFTMVMLCGAAALWGYWHLTHGTRRTRWAGPVTAVGLAGTLYAHYFALPLPLAIGVYHLLLAPKNCRWWGAVVWAGVAALLFLPAVAIVTRGASLAAADERLQLLAMGPLDTTLTLLRFYGAGFTLVGAALLLLGIFAAVTRRNPATVYPVFVALFASAVLVAMNAEMRIIMAGRERYFATLWAALVLAGTVGLAWVAGRWRVVGVTLATVLVMGNVGATLWGNLLGDIDGANELPWREMGATVTAAHSPDDALAFHAPMFPWSTKVVHDYYKADLPIRAELLASMPRDEIMRAYIADYNRMWLGRDLRFPAEPSWDTFGDILADDFVRCGLRYDAPDLQLELLARSPAYCADGGGVGTFGGITLTGVDLYPDGDSARVQASWTFADGVIPSLYSASYRLLDGDGTVVTRADLGFPQAPVALADVSLAAPVGNYEAVVIVYAWESGDVLDELSLGPVVVE